MMYWDIVSVPCADAESNVESDIDVEVVETPVSDAVGCFPKVDAETEAVEEAIAGSTRTVVTAESVFTSAVCVSAAAPFSRIVGSIAGGDLGRASGRQL
jgi:hypothetical protein